MVIDPFARQEHIAAPAHYPTDQIDPNAADDVTDWAFEEEEMDYVLLTTLDDEDEVPVVNAEAS